MLFIRFLLVYNEFEDNHKARVIIIGTKRAQVMTNYYIFFNKNNRIFFRKFCNYN